MEDVFPIENGDIPACYVSLGDMLGFEGVYECIYLWNYPCSIGKQGWLMVDRIPSTKTIC